MIKLYNRTVMLYGAVVVVLLSAPKVQALDSDDLVKCDLTKAMSLKPLGQQVIAGDLFTTGKYVRDVRGTKHDVYCLAMPNETKDELGLYSEKVELLTSIVRFGKVYFLGHDGRWYNVEGGYSIKF